MAETRRRNGAAVEFCERLAAANPEDKARLAALQHRLGLTNKQRRVVELAVRTHGPEVIGNVWGSGLTVRIAEGAIR